MKTLQELEAVRDKVRAQMNLDCAPEGADIRIVVGLATCGMAAGGQPVLDALIAEVERRELKNVQVLRTGCIGVCRLEPIVEVFVPGQERVTYVKMTPDKAREVVASHIINRQPKVEYTIGENE